MNATKAKQTADDFNPRSREGSDGRKQNDFAAARYFNPRSREGSDENYCGAEDDFLLFQSTLPRGERLHEDTKKQVAQLFQSTLPRGERLYI